jgi:thioredoxin-related protein
MKKSIVITLFFLSTLLSVQAQEWQTNFETAKTLAAQESHNIVLVFQGSDWCAPCIKLDKEVFSTAAFQEYAKDHFVMLKADFPRKKKNRLDDDQRKQNNELAEKYNQQGVFPFVVILDKEGKVLGQTGYQKMEPAAYVDLLTSFEK